MTEDNVVSATVAYALTITCESCGTPAGTDCTPPPAGHTRGRLCNRRIKAGWRLRMAAIVAEVNASAPSAVLLADALRELHRDVLDTWNPPGHDALLRLPLGHPDEAVRQELRGRVKSLCINLATRAHAGDSDEQLQTRAEWSINKIIKLDSGTT